MLYLSGAVRAEVLGVEGLGVMLTPHMRNRPDLSATPWAADTGCFAHPERFDVQAYLSWLGKLQQYRSGCLFATAPDRYGDAAATFAVGVPVLPLIRAAGFPAALVLQPGSHRFSVPWGELDAIFVGGPDPWRFTDEATGLVGEAKARGKWAHVGRVNSLRRLRTAEMAGFDSADGTFLAFGPNVNLPRLQRWLRQMAEQPSLMGVRS